LNPLLRPGANTQRQIYDELSDYYALGQKALIFQGRSNGFDPVKSTPWSYAQEVQIVAGFSNILNTQLNDDFNFTCAATFSRNLIYFGYIQCSLKTGIVAAQPSMISVNMVVFAYTNLAAGIFIGPEIRLFSSNGAIGSQAFFSNQPVMFNYINFRAQDSPANFQGVLDFAFYGQQISV